MILRIIKELWRLGRGDYIPKLPRGYAEHYERLSDDERRVLARYGGRSPLSAYRAMKKAGHSTLDGFVTQLKHHKPTPPVRRRWLMMLARFYRAQLTPPYRKDIIKATRKPTPQSDEIKARIKRVKELL